MLLSLFLIELAAGLYLFLPLVGRRNAGVKFYRMVLIIGGAVPTKTPDGSTVPR